MVGLALFFWGAINLRFAMFAANMAYVFIELWDRLRSYPIIFFVYMELAL